MTNMLSTIEPKSKKIPLTQGYEALVDDEDYNFLMQWKWHALKVKSGNFYAERTGNRKLKERGHIMMHRILNKTPCGFDTDHINGNGLDNRKSNLRTATRAQNMHNRLPNKIGTSKYKGVYWHKVHEKWASSIQINKKRIHIGLFDCEEDASEAYSERARVEFSNFNREVKYG